MNDRPDPDDRDMVAPMPCPECGFNVVDETPLRGPYGWYHSTCLPVERVAGTWLDHASDCPRGSSCNCEHPSLVVAQSMKWGNE